MNSQIIENILTLAVWGSVSASSFLGLYMLVQAWDDRQRRARFLVFGLVCAACAALDFAYSAGFMSHQAYEGCRVIFWSVHAAALLFIFEYRAHIVLAPLWILPLMATFAWYCLTPKLATSFVIPWSFLIAAMAHGEQYWRARGYASCVLCVQSLTLALMCGLYYPTLLTADPRVIGLGYLHYVINTVLSVLFGWVNLPRELRGKAPVRVSPQHAVSYGAAIMLLEAGIQLALLKLVPWSFETFLALCCLQLAVILLLFFYHRQQLVIYTDNVTLLLEERTSSLRQAQRELARQNDVQAEKLVEQAREIKSKSQVIERQRRLELAAHTAGQAAHDIQNLVSPVVLHLAELEKARLDPAAREGVVMLQRQMQELLELNGQLLTLTRRGRMDLHPIKLDELMHDLAGRFPAGRLAFDPGPAVWVEGSWTQLLRAFSNLITNALEAVQESQGRVRVRYGKEIVASVRQCHLGFLEPGEFACVEVEDNGPGIPGGIIDRIFEPFFSSKNRSGSSGSGLGLSIVAAIVDDHHGVLDLRTSASGTCFSIFFPVYRPADETRTSAPLCQDVTALVIDGDITAQSELAALLENEGCNVITAPGVAQALQTLQLEQVDVMIFDMQLSNASGHDLLFAAINLRPGIRSVVYTSYISAEDERHIRMLGASAVLTKPSNLQRVPHAVANALRERSAE